MINYDVIIIGGGPAGLICAKVLDGTDKRVLLLEKNEALGDKICAGGLTRKGLAILHLPDDVIEHKIYETALHAGRYKSETHAPEPFVFTISRKSLAAWQSEQIKGDNIEIRTNVRVAEIGKRKVSLGDGTEIGFQYLVGADGVHSIVRKYLEIPTKKRLIGVQYTVPVKDPDSLLELYMNSRLFHSWYAWIFPHADNLAIGSICNPNILSPKKLLSNLNTWLKGKKIDITNAKYDTWPISYDYRGHQFGNIFLAGEAAGLASGFTGEGIYQALVSGEAIAHYILDSQSVFPAMDQILRYNAIQEKILRFLINAGPFRPPIFKSLILLLNNKWIKERVKRGFS